MLARLGPKQEIAFEILIERRGVIDRVNAAFKFIEIVDDEILNISKMLILEDPIPHPIIEGNSNGSSVLLKSSHFALALLVLEQCLGGIFPLLFLPFVDLVAVDHQNLLVGFEISVFEVLQKLLHEGRLEGLCVGVMEGIYMVLGTVSAHVGIEFVVVEEFLYCFFDLLVDVVAETVELLCFDLSLLFRLAVGLAHGCHGFTFLGDIFLFEVALASPSERSCLP
jgi:hypothetical protein